jgi:hypothetical protein
MKKAPPASGSPQTGELLQSGIIFTAVSFVTGLGNMAFQAVMKRHLNEAGQYGNANSALNGFAPLLGLLPMVATFAVTHYIAHFNASGDHARLQGLLVGCRRFLFWFTVAGSVLAMVVIKPLSDFFHYHESLMLVTLIYVLVFLWSSLAMALCQGLAWFKRLALIGFLVMLLRVLFGWFVTLKWPTPETAVSASTFALLAYFIVLFWRKELVLHSEPVSPWNREFVQYLAVSAAFVGGQYFFTQGDLLVAKKFFTGADNDAYNLAKTLAVAIPITVSPLLTVLFTSRSGVRSGNVVAEQFKLLGLYILGLLFGAGMLFLLRGLCVKIISGRPLPEVQAMIAPLAITMVFVGLLQSLAYWSLASRWLKISMLYGALGLGYWLTLLALGKTPPDLLYVMPIASGMAFGAVCLTWLFTMRRHKPTPPDHLESRGEAVFHLPDQSSSTKLVSQYAEKSIDHRHHRPRWFLSCRVVARQGL